jgi:hypothetical protein
MGYTASFENLFFPLISLGNEGVLVYVSGYVTMISGCSMHGTVGGGVHVHPTAEDDHHVHTLVETVHWVKVSEGARDQE